MRHVPTFCPPSSIAESTEGVNLLGVPREVVIPTVLLAPAGSPDPAVLDDIVGYGMWRSLTSDGGFWDTLSPGIPPRIALGCIPSGS